VEVRGDYLFGRPVTRGHVRVVRETDREWNYQEQKWDITEEEKYEGELDASGRYVAHIDLKKEQGELSERDYQRMNDVRYAAYITDLTINRTEQRRFDLRLSKEPIHVYVIEDEMRVPDAPLYFYVSTFYADGSPAECEVEISQSAATELARGQKNRERFLRTVRTSRYGVAKVSGLELESTGEKTSLYRSDTQLNLTARDRQHRFGHHSEGLWYTNSAAVHVETDKALYRPGEPIEVDVASTKPAASLFVSVVRGWSLARTERISLTGGRGHITVPYSADFKDDVTILVYGYPQGTDFAAGTRTVLYPRNHELKLDLRTSQPIYRPGQEATADFHVTAADGQPIESALGVSVIDRAVDERTRTDSDFGDRYGGSFDRLWGRNDDVAGITRASLDRLDLSKPIDKNLQLAAEIILRGSSRHLVDVNRSESYRTDPDSLFKNILKSQLSPVESALSSRYARTKQYPKDKSMLIRELLEFGIDFAHMRDPWGNAYRVLKSVRSERDVFTIHSAGPDKQPDTPDDFTVSEMSWPYFRSSGEAIDTAAREYHRRTGEFIRDARALGRELSRNGIDINELRDPWRRPYRFEFGISTGYYTINIRSGGKNRRFEAKQNYRSDDFTVWTSRIDYFADTRAEIDKALSRYFEATRGFPQQQAEFETALRQSRIHLQSLRDPWGRSYYAAFKTEYRYGDRVKMMSYGKYNEGAKQRTELIPVTQQIAFIELRSAGPDGQKGTADDFSVATHSRTVAEQAEHDFVRDLAPSRTIFMGATGAIGGLVTDMTGAVIANATVKATNAASGNIYEGKTDDAGRYLLSNIPAGLYEVRFDSAGFKSTMITAVPVRSSSVTELDASLNVGTTAEMVMVTAQSLPVQTQSSSVSNVTTRAAKTPLGSIKQITQTSTPRLREYFPETLVWQPSIETDTSGRARLNFKLADNITTWKMSVIASTVDGEVASAQKEILAFQPFFIEHDPPRVLTEGDEIALPVVLRNYLDKTQSVNLEIKPESWFTLLTSAIRRAAIAAGDASREVFEFRATASIDEGKQRVTATGAEANDAIEKSVSVHPFGEQKFDTVTQVFTDSSTLEVNIPDGTIKNTVRGELKIYPNLMAHLLEGIEGIMRRPYGCAEQTISSTYPSLMVLRYYKRSGEDSPAIAEKAQHYLKAGYERLLNYRKDDGSFTYWGRGEGDVALTAYALRFLSDARELAAVDEDVINGARDWLIAHQRVDGSWPLRYSFPGDRPQTVSQTAFVARVLASTAKITGSAKDADSSKRTQAAVIGLKRALEFLSHATAELDEPYAIASYALAAINAGDEPSATRALNKLVALAHREGEASYWDLETNTPFYGWGLAGRIEATALAVEALALAGKASPDELVSRGLLFLLRQKDRYGVWYSSQATVNVFDALVTVLEKREPSRAIEGSPADVFLNGKQIASVSMPAPDKLTNPITIDLAPFLSIGANRIQIRRTSGSPQASAQLVATHYEPWPAASELNKLTTASAGSLKLRVNFDNSNAKIGEEITCTVEAERIGFRGYGMMLAEIGLPPGADVDRASLERAMTEAVWGIDQYDVLPDRLVVYLWPRAGGTRFQFKFRSRFGIAAQTAPSLVYDYYNPEARAVVAPTKFNIK
ncbi:MAG TPA: alpha-2-macroglobulin family protein, partial [Blastocatellia bacterium]|nr:alpha-2-macroglobulin family protein [Blastocatellia bacterium]